MIAQKQITIGPASKKQEMFLNSDATVTLAGGAAGCVDGETEFLSRTGWVKIRDFEYSTEIAEYNLDTETVNFAFPKNYIKQELEGDVFKRVNVRGLDMVMSTMHNVLYSDDRGKPKVLPFYEVCRRHDASKTKGWTGKIKTTFSVNRNGVDISEAELRLAIAVQADGRIVKEGKDNYTQMRFAKERKYLRLINLVKSADLRYKDNASKPCARYSRGLEYEIIVWPKVATKDLSCFWECSQEQLAVICDEVKHWDGSVTADGSLRYFTKHKYNADFIQYAFHACGYNTSILIDKTGCWTVNATKTGNGLRGIANKDGKKPFEVYTDHDGYKYCFEGSTGYFIARRSGRVFITGNSGKTFTSLLIALKFMAHPRATGVIFRRTSKMLTSPGSIWHEAVNLFTTLYPDMKIRHRETEMVFPNGALLKFSHMQHESNKFDHKGGQYSLVIFDEATDFEESMVVYLMSRMRNAYVNYTPQMFLMTNPEHGSFLRHWIQDYYLDPTTGIPLPERTGHKRWFFRQGNTMLWYNTKEEAELAHGAGPSSGLSTFTFIGATCQDNPPLLKAQPDYISRLMSMPRVEMERLLHGSWFARAESSGLFKREWCQLVEYPNGRATQRIRSWDLAFSKPSEQYPNPDWTRGVLISKDKSKVYTVEDVVGMRDRVHKVEELIFATAARDGKGVTISIPQDPAAAAGAYAKDLQRRLSELGYSCRLTRPVKSKVTRFAPFSGLAQAGFVQVVTADWNKDFFEELENFDGNPKKKDDMCDCCSDCIILLNKELHLPTFSLPTFTNQSSNFGFQANHLGADTSIQTLTF